jgi:hypothetical protein
MTSHRIRSDCRNLQEAIRNRKLSYEIYPDLNWQTMVSPATWFEIVLHAETEEYRPPDHPKSQEVFSALMDVADLLIQQIPSHAPYSVDLSAAYYTVHPPGCGEISQTRLSRSLSLIFNNVGLHTNFKEHSILAHLKNQLSLLNVPKLKRLCDTEWK